jgi:hypothetical protein
MRCGVGFLGTLLREILDDPGALLSPERAPAAW